jgi:hypothetical protein
VENVEVEANNNGNSRKSEGFRRKQNAENVEAEAKKDMLHSK